MPHVDDGDPIRALGFVTMHFAHLEAEIDSLLEDLATLTPIPPQLHRYRVGDKVRRLRQLLIRTLDVYPTRYLEEDKWKVKRVLRACKGLADMRNDLLHQPIFGDMKRGQYQMLKSGVRRKLITRDMYKLSDAVQNACGGVHALRFIVGRMSHSKSEAHKE